MVQVDIQVSYDSQEMNTKPGKNEARVKERSLRPHVILDYGIAVLSVIMAAIIIYLIKTNLSDNPPYVAVFLCAVIFTTWFGGTKAGLFSILLSTLALGYYFLTPFRSFALDFAQILILLFFMVPSFFIVWLNTIQRKTNTALREEIAERKLAEEALQRIQDHLRLITDTIPVHVWSAHPDGSFDFINQRYREFTGLSLDDVQGWRWMAIVHPDDLTRVVEEWRTALQASEPLKTEFRCQGATGNYCWFLVNVVPLRDKLGRIVKWYGTKIDITELKQAEDTLRKNEDRIRLIIDTIPTMVWTVQPDGTVDFFNQRWLDYTGHSLELMEDPLRIIHPEDLPRATEKWLTNMAAGKPFEDEIRLRGADGKYRWFLIRTAPLHDEQGNLVKWYGVSIDIEDSKQLDEALRESEQRYHSLFQNMTKGVVHLQMLFKDSKLQDAIFLEVNPSWEKLTGLRNAIGRKITEVFPGILEAGSEFLERSVRVALTGQSERFEAYSHHLKKWLSVSAYCLKKEHVILLLDDITERKVAEDKLRLAHQHLSYHVENTPLAVIECDKDLFIRRWSKTAEDIFGWEASEALGKNMNDADFHIIYKEDLSAVDTIKEELIKGTVNRNLSLNRNYTKDGRVIYNEWYNSVLRDDHGNVITILSLVHHVTERKKTEEKLQLVNSELHRLSLHLQNIQENERTAIAREIHDELGQLLTGLKMEVGWLNKKLPDDLVLKEKGSEILSIVSDLLKTVKRIAIDLRPNILDELGLIAALKWQGQEFEKSRKTEFQFHTNLNDFNPERNLSTNIFRVHQEALTNIARHAQATRIETTLEKTNDWLRLTIQDNGKGFDVNEEKDNNSFGLIGMKERALMLRGELIIESEDSKGTVITLKVPLLKTEPKES